VLDRWIADASPGWSTTTLRETRSVIEGYLKPVLAHLALDKLTTLMCPTPLDT
jgi:Phage integrase, N-terminal SAM-like domain